MIGLLRRGCLLLPVINFALVLQVATIIAEFRQSLSTHSAVGRLQRLNLVFKRVIDALALDRMIHAFWACYILNCHLGTERHTLMNVSG